MNQLVNLIRNRFYIKDLFNLRRGLFPSLYIKNNRKSRKLLGGYYSPTAERAKNEQKMVICMVDGRCQHGGISDRLMGALSIYYMCKQCNVDFKIHFTSPFRLGDYLIPNKYDWLIAPEDISYNSKDSNSYRIRTKRYRGDTGVQRKLIKRIIAEDFKQIHIYSNSDIALHEEYSTLFSELFKPTPDLASAVNLHKQNIGGEYIDITFRFQQLLGDFKEGRFSTLSESEQEELIQKCMDKTAEILKANPGKRCLITSDSVSFLKRVAEQQIAYTIPGELVHMDFTANNNYEIHKKSFVDFLCIAEAQKVYVLQTGLMYNTLFPYSASLINRRAFERVVF